MTILTVSSVSLAYGTDEILNDISFTVNEGERLGVIGANGAGKTTLFNILTGRLQPDRGNVTFARGAKAKLLSQKPEEDFGGRTVLDWALDSFSGLHETERRLAELERRLADGHSADAARYAALEEEFRRAGGYEYKAKTRSMLERFGFSAADFDKPAALLSGGQKTRLALLSVLVSDTDVLLLDEPTNHLDLETTEWLEEFIRSSKKTFLIVSHDRYFLDRVTTKTLELEHTRAAVFSGPYSVFKRKKQEQRDAQMKHYLQQQKEIKRIEDFVANQRRWNRERNIIAAESRLKALDRMVKLEKPKEAVKAPSFAFQTAAKQSSDVLSVRGVSKTFGSAPLLTDVSFELKLGDRLFIVGANGSGKSTLIKILTSRLEPDRGRYEYGYNQIVGFYDQEQQLIDYETTVLGELWDENGALTMTQVRTTLASFGFTGDDVFKANAVLSGGERARLSIAKLILKGASLLILDEPTNHLDIASREVLESALAAFGGTVLCVSHDRFFISSLATRILELDRRRYPDGSALYELPYDAFLEKRPPLPQQTAAEAAAPVRETVSKPNVDLRRVRKRHVIVENEIGRREKALSDIKARMNGEESSDYMALAALAREEEAVNAELQKLYDEYLELEALLEE